MITCPIILRCLSHNKLSSFGRNLLRGSTNLRKIVLRSNQLKSIDEKAFCHASENLRVIDLCQNNLSVKESFIETLLEKLPLLTVLDLSHNDFHGSYYVTSKYRRNYSEFACQDIRTKVTITKLVDGSPLEDARLSDLYIPCAEAGLVGSGDGFIQY
jgi:hypothetical protein